MYGLSHPMGAGGRLMLRNRRDSGQRHSETVLKSLLRLRRAVANFIKRHKWLDNNLGKQLRTLDRKWLFAVRRVRSPISQSGFLIEFERKDLAAIAPLLINGEYEPVTLRTMASIVRPGDVIVDGGANIGIFTLHAARAVGSAGRVIAFEPMQRTAGLLR